MGFLVLIGALSAWSTYKLVDTSGSVAHTHEVLTYLEALLSQMKDAETTERGFLLTNDESYLDLYKTAEAGYKQTLKLLREKTIDNKTQTDRIDKELTVLVDERFKEMQAVIDKMKKDGQKAAVEIVKKSAGRAIAVKTRKVIEAMQDEENRLLKTRNAEANQTVQITYYTVGIGTGLAVVFVGFAGFLMARSITTTVRDAVDRLTTSGAEIVAGTTQQAAGAQEQAAAVAQTVATVEEVALTADQAAQRAKGVGEAIQRTTEIGKAGRKGVEESIAATSTLKEQIEATAENILMLAEQAQAIGAIIATVNDIAEQTNLLALNAAIEASRAGEHGRGFAVVAGEVKALADQSKKATSQVRQILGEIQKATNTAVLSTEEVTRGVGMASKMAGQAGETIKVLVDTLGEAAQATAHIMASAGQQATGMAQINQAIKNIDLVARQNLAATTQADQAAQTLNALANELAQFIAR
jgi:methyl-accepting chemotaxis protein